MHGTKWRKTRASLQLVETRDRRAHTENNIDRREHFEERAAILEYCAGFARDAAEILARKAVRR